jgi:hypothetical protein
MPWGITVIEIKPTMKTIYCHVQGGTRDEMKGSSSDDWIYKHFGYTFSLIFN